MGEPVWLCLLGLWLVGDRGLLTWEVGFCRNLMNRVYPYGAYCKDTMAVSTLSKFLGMIGYYLQASQPEQAVKSNTLWSSQLKMPREDHGHDIKNNIRREHYRRVNVKEDTEVDAVSGKLGIPSLVEWPALK